MLYVGRNDERSAYVRRDANDEVKHRPLYVVRERANLDRAAEASEAVTRREQLPA